MRFRRCGSPEVSADRKSRRGAAAVEFAVTLPLLLVMLLGMWEAGRVADLQQLLAAAAREGARQAGTGLVTNAQVQQVSLNYLKAALNDTSGTKTQHVTVTVQDLTHPGTDVSAASTLDQLQVAVSIPFSDVSWSGLSLVTNSSTVLSSQCIWVSCVDVPYPVTVPEPPQG